MTRGLLDYFESEFTSDHLGEDLSAQKRRSRASEESAEWQLPALPEYLRDLGATDTDRWMSRTRDYVESIPATEEALALAINAIERLAESQDIDLGTSDDFHRATRGVAAICAKLGERERLYDAFDAVCSKFTGYDQHNNLRKFDRYLAEAQNDAQHIGPEWLFSITGLQSELRLLLSSSSSGPPDNHDPPPEVDGGEAAIKNRALAAERLPPFDELVVKPRPTVWGPFLMRRAITLLGGAGGTGKSAFSLTLAVSMAIGRDLLGLNRGARQHDHKRVLVLNNEDDPEEITRRLAAILQHHKVTATEYALAQRNLFFRSGTVEPVKLAGRLQSEPRKLHKTKWIRTLESFCQTERIDAVFVDPLVSLHDAQENDNVEMDIVMQISKQLASSTDVAILLIHHTRKESSTNADDAFRGASAVVNAARAVILLSRMTDKEAKKLDLSGSERTRFFRMDFGKHNYGLPPDGVSWFRNESVMLRTGLQAGDRCPVSTSHDAVAVGVPVPVILEPIETDLRNKTSAAAFVRALHRETWPVRITEHYSTLKKVCDVQDQRSVRRRLSAAIPMINDVGKSEAARVVCEGTAYRTWLERPSRSAGLFLHREPFEEQK